MENREFIVCSANYYVDGLTHPHQPINISHGFVVCGLRHHNCINTFAQIYGFPYSEETLKIKRTEEQGFLTNTNKFVNREYALEIAIKANQLKDGNNHNLKKLHSEDLW